MVRRLALRTIVFLALATVAGPVSAADTTHPAAPVTTPTAAPDAPKAPSAPSSPVASTGAPGAKKAETKSAEAGPAKDTKDTNDSKNPKDLKSKADSSQGSPSVTATDASVESKPKAKTKAKTHSKSAAQDPPERVGEGPSPASPPPLTVGGLRDEMRRERGGGTIDPATPARTKVEQMLAEVTKARESLHDDTARLEAMLNPEGEGAGGGAAAAGAAPGTTKPAAKNPLDIVAKALRAIKPEQAAPIVSKLDKRLAATVLQRMPPVDAGKILGAMKADTAAELATQIAMRSPSGSEVKR